MVAEIVTASLASYRTAHRIEPQLAPSGGHEIRGILFAQPYVSEIDGDGLSEAKRVSDIAREDAFDNGTLTIEWHGHAVDIEMVEP